MSVRSDTIGFLMLEMINWEFKVNLLSGAITSVCLKPRPYWMFNEIYVSCNLILICASLESNLLIFRMIYFEFGSGLVDNRYNLFFF